jgi:hypothetical protein
MSTIALISKGTIDPTSTAEDLTMQGSNVNTLGTCAADTIADTITVVAITTATAAGGKKS